jgi:hypothetical protein
MAKQFGVADSWGLSVPDRAADTPFGRDINVGSPLIRAAMSESAPHRNKVEARWFVANAIATEA